MKTRLVLLPLLLGVTLCAQVSDEKSNPAECQSLVYPKYPGGINSMRKEIVREYKVPRSFMRSGVKGGTIVAQFLIDENGVIEEVRVVVPLIDCDECNEEAKRVFSHLKETFTPGLCDGKISKIWYTFPIKLETTQDEFAIHSILRELSVQTKLSTISSKYIQENSLVSDVMTDYEQIVTDNLTNSLIGKIAPSYKESEWKELMNILYLPEEQRNKKQTKKIEELQSVVEKEIAALEKRVVTD